MCKQIIFPAKPTFETILKLYKNSRSYMYGYFGLIYPPRTEL